MLKPIHKVDDAIIRLLSQLSPSLKWLSKYLNKKTMELDVTTIYPDWTNPEIARHNLRVICDQEGLTVHQKNLMSQVIHCESGYHINAINENTNSKGVVTSVDRGICQWNDFWHGKEITNDEALHDPEKALRLMCTYVKAGRINQWVCFSSGMFRSYSP